MHERTAREISHYLSELCEKDYSRFDSPSLREIAAPTGRLAAMILGELRTRGESFLDVLRLFISDELYEQLVEPFVTPLNS